MKITAIVLTVACAAVPAAAQFSLLARIAKALDPVPLTACVSASSDQRDCHRSRFAPAFTSMTEDPAACEIQVRCTENGGNLEFVEAATGQSLFVLTPSTSRWGAEQARRAMYEDIKSRLSPGGEMFKSIVRRGGSAPATVAAAPAVPAAAVPQVETLVPSFKSAERLDDLAIIVGIETYSEIQSKATFAERDADAFKAHVRALGVPERNIVLLKGSKAGKASLEKNVETWLGRLAKPTSRVYFYFSGHGAPDVKTGQAYLVPWDGDPNFLEDTAYPVARLYKKLGALPAQQVLVAMDSCFSGAGGRSVLATGARPLVAKIDTGVVPKTMTVLAASASNEISGSLEDKGHGAFTYFLLEGLNAGEKTPKALAAYLTPRVQDEAKRLNRDQTPQLQGDGSWSLR